MPTEKYVIYVDKPRHVSAEEMRKYVKRAIENWWHYDDLFFDCSFAPDTVEVKWIAKQKRNRTKKIS